MDALGKGRYPAQAETCIIFWITDAQQFSTSSGVSDILNIPGLKTPGKEMFIEPFRWEQRLYTLALLPESRTRTANPNVPIMSLNMGGEYWEIKNLKSLVQCIETSLGVSQRNPLMGPFYTSMIVF